MTIPTMSKLNPGRPYNPGALTAPKHLPFVRAAFAVAQGKATGEGTEAVLKGLGCEVAPLIVYRANQTPGSTTVSGWGAELAEQSFGAFLTDLAPYAAGRVIAQAIPARLGRAVSSLYPVRAAGPVSPAWVGEGDAIPVRSSDFDNIQVGPSRKLAHILAWSRELGQRSDAIQIFGRNLREDVALGLDAALLSTSAGTASVHQGLLNGVSAGTGEAGGDTTAMQADLMDLASTVAVGGSGNVLFVVSPDRLARLRILDPVLAASLDVAGSAAVPTDRVIALDAASLLISIDPQPDIELSRDGVIQMSDVPLEIVSDAPVVSDPVRSLWQSATVALRVLHDIAFAKSRATAVAYLDGATW